MLRERAHMHDDDDDDCGIWFLIHLNLNGLIDVEVGAAVVRPVHTDRSENNDDWDDWRHQTVQTSNDTSTPTVAVVCHQCDNNCPNERATAAARNKTVFFTSSFSSSAAPSSCSRCLSCGHLIEKTTNWIRNEGLSHRSLFTFGRSYLTTLTWCYVCAHCKFISNRKQNIAIIAAGYVAPVKVIINHRRRHRRRRCNVARLQTVRGVHTTQSVASNSTAAHSRQL